jgi:molybdenum cofactor guanylyltransferase
MNEVDSFILIGGKSSRFGTDKAFVKLDGETLLERATKVVRDALPLSRVTAVAANATTFAIQAITSGVPFVLDLHENRGPLGGLHSALANARTPWIFLLACDYPLVSPELIRLLQNKISDEFGAIVPEQKDGRLQPLCAFYHVSRTMAVVEEILERPRVSPPVHEVVSDVNPLIVRFDEYAHLPQADMLFVNVNTPADLDIAGEIKRKLSAPD